MSPGCTKPKSEGPRTVRAVPVTVPCEPGVPRRASGDLDTVRGGVATTPVTPRQQQARTLDDDTVLALAAMGTQIAAIQGDPQDVEWAVADGTIWILQARPITAALPTAPLAPTSPDADRKSVV